MEPVWRHRYHFVTLLDNHVMLADFVISNWNDLLTVLAFAISVITGYYQVRHYWDQRPKIKIRSVENAYYFARSEEPDDCGDYRPIQGESPENRDDILDTQYRFTLKTENDGYEPATISEGNLILNDTKEELVLVDSTRCGPEIRDDYNLMIEFEANQPNDITLCSSGAPRDKYEEEVDGMIRLNTTTGTVEEPATFTLRT